MDNPVLNQNYLLAKIKNASGKNYINFILQ
jgi:hypothetical protein